MSELNGNLEIERQALLKDLKRTVEGLLISQVTNVWNVYGGLNRLHQAMDKIFRHQFKVYKPDDGEPDIMVFIQGLDWLQPNSSSVNVESVHQPHIPIHLKYDKSSIWLYRSLENHSLSQKLSWLISDKEHLLSCYEPSAFLCQEKFCEATLICLRAVEQYQPALLSEINPSLLLTNFELNDTSKMHRRSSSFPTVGSSREWIKKTHASVEDSGATMNLEKEVQEIQENANKLIDNLSKDTVDGKNGKSLKSIQDNRKFKNVGKLKPWNSLTDLKHELHKSLKMRERSATISQYSSTTQNTPTHNNSIEQSPQRKLSPSVLRVDYSKIQVDTSLDNLRHNDMIPSKKTHPYIFKNEPIYVENEQKSPKSSLSESNTPHKEDKSDIFSIGTMPIRKLVKVGQIISGSDPDYSFMSLAVLAGQKDLKRCPKKSFIEDGGSSITPMSTGYFPRPIQGQSLTSFLSSGQFSHTSAELDRENAHFSISEAMIAAIEQVKFNNRMKIECGLSDDSDKEIGNLSQRIRLRKKRKSEQNRKKMPSDSLSDSTITPPSSLPNTRGSSSSTDCDADDLDVESASNIADSRSLSASLASLYSESDILKKPREAPDGQSDCVLSAEGVALSLISKFKPKQLPKASDLEWLVSELDAPQQLLPLPTSWPISPDASLSSSPDHITPLRGTADWAPPRPQIIFTPHPIPTRRLLMEKQNYRCAGCGMRVAIQYASRFRYCDYLGRYFCTGCHSNQLAVIPGRILSKWDFNRYHVSNFSYRLLDQMSVDPLFNIGDINPGLYKKIKQLEKCRNLRLQLFYLKDFIMSCRFAKKEQEFLQTENTYMLTEPEIYSINDLYAVKKGDLLIKLKEKVEVALLHIDNCELCKARGFVCEVCMSNDIIFPWQIQKISRCNTCGACYHQSCWRYEHFGAPCKRCLRLKYRRESRQLDSPPSSALVEKS